MIWFLVGFVFGGVVGFFVGFFKGYDHLSNAIKENYNNKEKLKSIIDLILK